MPTERRDGDPNNDDAYTALLAEGKRLSPEIRIGRPGVSRLYWFTIAVMRLLRLGMTVELHGAEHLRRGTPAILVANHTSAWDPVCVVVSGWWRVTAFTKAEYFASRGSFFFRWMGQIPLRRGDAASTDWAMRMSQQALAKGGMIGIYPEGTRSPDGRLHKLHKRVLIPLLQANPDVAVHAVTMAYEKPPRGRVRVHGRISPPVRLDSRTGSPEELTRILRDALIETGGQEYVDEYAQTMKKTKKSPRATA
ncbi:MAG TPA: lysophospholipid acyltransferase family protein [Frankiaceae bacterium]|nr:lysophospholipid acyltransferase family protein [Frankiaceae bacterium]